MKEKEIKTKCPFKPKILSYEKLKKRPSNVYEKLMNESRDLSKMAERKAELEVEGCTFQPRIDKKSA